MYKEITDKGLIYRINPPKFRIGKYILNEYELRSLMLEVAQGHSVGFIGSKVTQEGCIAYITADGSLNGRLPGLHIATDIAIKHMEIKNKNKNF